MPSLRSICCLLLIALGVACTRRLPAPGVPKVKGAPIVAKLEFVGLEAISRSELVEGLALRTPYGRISRTETYFDSASMRVDKRRIETFYRDKGYLEAKVVDMETRALSSGRVALRYTVVEGQRTHIGNIRFEQEDGRAYPEDQLVKEVELGIGKALIYSRYEDGQRKLVHFLADKGHAFASVQGRIFVDPKTHKADVLYVLSAGPKVVFGKTRIDGIKRLPTASVTERLAYEEGEAFSPNKMRATLNSLYGTGFISLAQFDFDRNAKSEKVDLELQIKEAPRNETKTGPGLGMDNSHYEARWRLEYTRRSFLFPNAILGIEAKPRASYFRGTASDKPLGGEALARLEFLDLPGAFYSLTGTVGYSIDDFATYTGTGPKGSVSLRRSVGERLTLSTAWHWHSQTLSRVDEDLSDAERASVGLQSPYQVGYFKQTLTYDGRDRPLGATRGIYLQMLVEESGSYTLSDFSYYRVTPEARAYLELWPGLIVAGRLGLGSSLGDSELVPISQRYFAGGSSSHRGFGMRRLSPRGGEGRVPIGGEAIIDSSLELRFAPFGSDTLSYAGFLDGGDVTMTTAELDLLNLHWATGIGLRYPTPIGLLRTDVALRLNRFDAIVDSTWQWHLGLGEAF